jgi:rubrerythrin
MALQIQKDSQTKSSEGDNSNEESQAVARQALIEGLNHDLAGEYQAIVMYTHYSAKLTGPYRRELRALFQMEIPDEQGHAQFLADKIANWGASRRPGRARFLMPSNRGRCSKMR